jgi:hypothetical protein
MDKVLIFNSSVFENLCWKVGSTEKYERCKLYEHSIRLGSRDSLVGIATGYGLGDRGVGV